MFQRPAGEHQDAHKADDQINQHFQLVDKICVHKIVVCAATVLFRGQRVEREIQLQNIHARFAEKTETGAVGVGADEFAHFVFT